MLINDLPCWVVHKDKIPHDPKTGKRASSTDPRTWATKERAELSLRGGHWDGIGIVFTSDNHVFGIDIDNGVSGGQIKPWAQEIIDSIDSYAEVSPSGNGIHILALGPQLHSGHKVNYADGHVEVYSSGRYFTFTGNHIEGTPSHLSEANLPLKSLFMALGIRDTPPPDTPQNIDFTPTDVPETLIDALTSEPDFLVTWECQRSEPNFHKDDGSPDGSAYDLALATMACGMGVDDNYVVSLLKAFRTRHGLSPAKAERPDYLARTLAKAKASSPLPSEGAAPEIIHPTDAGAAPPTKDGGDETGAPAEDAPPKPSKLDPLTEDATRVAGRLIVEPPPAEFILEGLLARRTVGAVVAVGGMGKTYFLMQLAHTLASGGNLGPFRAVSSTKVLMLAAEDPPDVIDRRLWPLGRGSYPDNLHIASVTGKIGPLVQLKGGKAIRTEWYLWLRRTIEAHPGLQCLILDPMSRFSGLEENDNNQATRWVAMLESLVDAYGITVLFSHHVAKTRSDEMSQAMARGASGLVDGCRWVAGLTQMNKKDAQKFEVENPRDFIVMDVVKSNYAAKLPAPIHMRRGEAGVLEYVELRAERQGAMLEAMCSALAGMGERLTRREITRGHQGRVVRDVLADQFGSVPRSTLEKLVDEALEQGLMEERFVPMSGAGADRREIVPTEVPF